MDLFIIDVFLKKLIHCSIKPNYAASLILSRVGNHTKIATVYINFLKEGRGHFELQSVGSKAKNKTIKFEHEWYTRMYV